jgi:ABC-type Fe3+/spermidine/putrescine transport system ATPase subunit
VKDCDDHFPAVELRGVSKRFGQRVILERIDLSIARGELLVLVGPSGSGKSTLLKIVSGIETPDTGRVLLAGDDCTELPPYRRPVHTVFQSYALFPHLDVTENIAFPLAVAGMRVESLSGGERQRVALARALVDSPQCVLLDEPLSALDPHLRAETLDLLTGIQARLGTTFLFITHDREEALRLGHRIGVLNQGRLEQLGPPEELYRQPRTAFVASFLGKINWLPGELIVSGGTKSVVIAGQQVPFAECNGRAAPGRVKIGIRPEDMCIGEGFSLTACVTGRQFLGDSVVVRLTLADGTALVADQRTPLAHAALDQQVRVGWPPEALHLFPSDECEAQS